MEVSVKSVSGNFVFNRVIWEEIDGCIGSGRFAEYIDFKVGQLLNYEKVMETYTSVTLMCGVELYVCVYLELYVCVYLELYVCVYLVYVFVDEFGVCSFGVVYD